MIKTPKNWFLGQIQGKIASMNPNVQIPAVNPIGEALHHLQMNGAFYCRSELTAPFGIEMPPMAGTLMFHVVTQGECLVEVVGEKALTLRPGTFLMVPHGKGHVLATDSDAPLTPLFDLPRELISERYECLKHGGGGEPTTMFCGAVTFDHPAAVQLLKQLPGLVLVDAWNAPESEWLQSTLRFIASEAQILRLGGETIITRLCDVLVIQAIRSWLSHTQGPSTGWLAALRDEEIGKAIALVHRSPEHVWSVPDLAAASAMSRSAFASKFARLVGEPPMRYVTRWRIYVAHGWLKKGGTTVAQAASRLGYSSEAAFSRAFKRFTGTSPGAVRRTHSNVGDQVPQKV